MMKKDNHIKFLKQAIQISQLAREHGNTPFGSLLVDEKGKVLLEQENIEVTGHICTGHAETTLAARASQMYEKDFLWKCALYTTAEPCAMCSGTIYWSNIGTVVYGMTEKKLLELTGDNDQNPTFMTRYEGNFKQMIVEFNQTGRSVRRLAKEYGLSEAMIYKWKNLYLPNHPIGVMGKEVVELRKENARLKEELEILKKATAIFSRKT